MARSPRSDNLTNPTFLITVLLFIAMAMVMGKENMIGRISSLNLAKHTFLTCLIFLVFDCSNGNGIGRGW